MRVMFDHFESLQNTTFICRQLISLLEVSYSFIFDTLFPGQPFIVKPYFRDRNRQFSVTRKLYTFDHHHPLGLEVILTMYQHWHGILTVYTKSYLSADKRCALGYMCAAASVGIIWLGWGILGSEWPLGGSLWFVTNLNFCPYKYLCPELFHPQGQTQGFALSLLVILFRFAQSLEYKLCYQMPLSIRVNCEITAPLAYADALHANLKALDTSL